TRPNPPATAVTPMTLEAETSFNGLFVARHTARAPPKARALPVARSPGPRPAELREPPLGAPSGRGPDPWRAPVRQARRPHPRVDPRAARSVAALTCGPRSGA